MRVPPSDKTLVPFACVIYSGLSQEELQHEDGRFSGLKASATKHPGWVSQSRAAREDYCHNLSGERSQAVGPHQEL